MRQYRFTIDGGINGEDVFEAEDMREAIAMAREWAEEGDWTGRQGIIRPVVGIKDLASGEAEVIEVTIDCGRD